MNLALGMGLNKVRRGALLNQTPEYFNDGLQYDNGKIILQFDDGYADNYTNALPVILAKGVKCTIFAQTSFIGNTGEGAMTWAQLQAMHAAGIDIQCHMHNFGQLTAGTNEQILADLATANGLFTANNIPIPEHIAYGGGAFDDRVLDLLDDYFLTGRTVVVGQTSRKPSRYKLPTYSLSSAKAGLKTAMDYAKANKTAMILFGHRCGGTTGGLYVSVADFEELIDYGKSIGCDFLTTKEHYDLMFYTDLRLSRNCADDAILVVCKNKLPSGYSISVERSDDGGLNYTEVTVLPYGTTDYLYEGLTLHKDYFYRCRGVKGTNYLPYSEVEHISTAVTLVLTSTGTGAGVSTFQVRGTENFTMSLDGNGKFYTNSGGTEGESSTVTVVANVLTTVYIKVTSGASNLKISKNILDQIGAWTSGTNAATMGGNVDVLSRLTVLNVQGSNTISGDVSKMPDLNTLFVLGSNTLSGSIAGLTTLNYLRVVGSNTLSGSIANLTLLTFVTVAGSTTITGSIANLTLLTYFYLAGTNTVSGSVNALTNLTYAYIAGSNTVTGDVRYLSSKITYLYIKPSQMVDYTSGGNWGALTAGATVQIEPAAGYGLSSAEVDQLIIDIATTKVAGRAITVRLQGSNAARTSASDAARATIIADGGSVLTN